MESWSYISEERSYLFSDEMDFSLDAYMRSRKPLVEWENKSSYNFERDGFNSDREVVKSMEFVDLGFPMETSRTIRGSVQTSSCELDSNNSIKRENSSIHVIAFDSSFVEEDSESKHLSSLVESKNHDSSLIDLKLGRLVDCQSVGSDRDAKTFISESVPIHQTVLAKRSRTSSLPALAPVCQVYGCNMDLSSSKDYHKRHKVCDVHSKTAKVIVNGVEQRFCQQCSRFHLVAEFDDGKRSCRRRLAGHNDRRRRPQPDYMTSKQHKILQSYQGTHKFSFQDIFQSGILFPEKHDQISQSGHIKLEEDPICSPQLEAPATHGHKLSSHALSLLSAQSQNPSHHAAGNPSATSSTFFWDIRTQDRGDQVSETHLMTSSVNKHEQNGSFPCVINSMEIIKSEHGATIDLFQLSSNLQRVEKQRNSVLVKWENEDCCFSNV